MTIEQVRDIRPLATDWSRWWAVAVAAAGALTAVRAETSHDAVVVLLTAAVAGAATGIAWNAGALSARRWGDPANWGVRLVSLPFALAGAVALFGWPFPDRLDVFMAWAQIFNGGNIGIASFALWRITRLRRLDRRAP